MPREASGDNGRRPHRWVVCCCIELIPRPAGGCAFSNNNVIAALVVAAIASDIAVVAAIASGIAAVAATASHIAVVASAVATLLSSAALGEAPTGSMLSLAAGLVALLSARAFGADAIAITDLKASNLSLATRLGADAAVLIESQQQAPQDVADALLAANAGIGFDIVIDCAGFQQSMQVR